MKKYELLAEDIEALIASGTIQPGERLPSVRQTITARHLSPSTVFEGLYRFGVLCIFCSAVLQRGRFAPKHAVHEYRVVTTPLAMVPMALSALVEIETLTDLLALRGGELDGIDDLGLIGHA